MDKYNPEQFEIIGLANDKRGIDDACIQGNKVYLAEQHKKFVGMVLKEGDKLFASENHCPQNRKLHFGLI